MSPHNPGRIPGPGGSLWPLNLNQRLQPPNWFNGALQREQHVWQQINALGGLRAICPGKVYEQLEPPWIKMPKQGRSYRAIGSLALPAAGSGDQPVVFMDGRNYFIVPYGYDGVIQSVVFSYVGGATQLQQGSGDLTWRLFINQYYARDFGKVTTELGSLTNPSYVNNGQILLVSGQRVQILVNRSAASAGTISGGRIIGAAMGWFYPR